MPRGMKKSDVVRLPALATEASSMFSKNMIWCAKTDSELSWRTIRAQAAKDF